MTLQGLADYISIPAPARGATQALYGWAITALFQFPPLREGRPVLETIEALYYGISIPAPARGATQRDRSDKKQLFHFNSRPCARGDLA